MKSFEFEAKEIFKRNNIQIPKGAVISDPAPTEQIAASGNELAIKAQALVRGR